MDQNPEGQEPQKTPEGTPEPHNDGTGEPKQYTPEEIAELEKRASQSSQNFERAKAAEAELKKFRAQAPAATPEVLSTADTIFLAKTDIHEEDLDEVLERSKSRKISVKEAYQQLKPLLDSRAEERRSAAAAHTRGGRSAPSETKPSDLLRKAEESGEVPDSETGMKSVAQARLDRKRKK